MYYKIKKSSKLNDIVIFFLRRVLSVIDLDIPTLE